jgi:hypothetical protein
MGGDAVDGSHAHRGVRRPTPLTASGAVLALVAALLAVSSGPVSAGDIQPAPDVVIVCPVLIVGESGDGAGDFDVEVPQGADILVVPALQVFGFTEDGAPPGGFLGCETFDPMVLLDLDQDGDLLFFESGVVELGIASGGTALSWATFPEALSTRFWFGEAPDLDGPPDLDWTFEESDTVLRAGLEELFPSPLELDEEGFVAGGFPNGFLFMELKGDTAPGDYTVTATFTLNLAGIEPMAESDTEVLTVSRTITVVTPRAAAAPAPGATVSCTAPVVGAVVTCDLQSDPNVEFVWEASTNPVFASGVVTTNAAGVGRFVFTVPASALGQPVLVEIVEWTAATSIGIAAGPVPTSVPSGGGPRAPAGDLLVLGVAVLGAALLVRLPTRRATRSAEGPATV